MVRATFFALLIALSGGKAIAQETTWKVINEYPASSLPGEADVFFAEAVKRGTQGRLTIVPVPDAQSGLRSREQLKAVSDGRFAMADTFGGALSDEDSAFLLSSLPFITPSSAHARKLYETALPLYEKLFADRGQKLLYVSPWPPSGIWSDIPVSSRGALAALKIRTYDKTGTELFAKVSAQASVVSFADLNPKLEAGEINAVLSSGDGGAGRQLWKYLRNFCSINYAIPLSFAAVSLAEWNKLDPKLQAAVDQAARDTTAHQWEALENRVARNFKIMRDNKVVIIEQPALDVVIALAAAGAQALIEWQGRASPEAIRALEAYQR
jgi:TRAP-type C4-dicarboxylate transport system substrate-binding protein